MKKISVYFTDRQYAALMHEAEDRGLTFAEVLRRVIDVWLDTVCPYRSNQARERGL
jgi:hypothetical protein